MATRLKNPAVLASPPVTAQPPVVAAPFQAVVDPRKEYVSAGQLQYLATFLRAVSSYIDDVEQDLGIDTYERMMHDPTVSSAINTLKTGILANTPKYPAVKLPTSQKEDSETGLTTSVPHPAQDTAEEIAAFCSRMMANLDTPIGDVLWNMLDALAYGHKVAEKVYDFGENEDAGRLVLKKLKVKPRRSTAFVIDAFSNVVGLLGLIPGVSFTVQTQGMFTDPALVPNFLPRDKFAVLTCRESDADPRGKSLLRPAYYAWYCKTQAWPEYLKFLSLYAIPVLVGKTAEGDMTAPAATFSDGVTPMLDSYGNPIYLTPQQAMINQLVGLRNATAIVVPAGAEVNTLESKGDGAAFLSANEVFNREIEKAITGQTLATSEAEHDTRAASQTHQDILGGLMTYGRALLETMLYRDVLRPTVIHNFGDEAGPLTPWPVLSDAEQQDLTGLWAAVASLQTSGYLDASQKIALDAQVGLPERSQESVVKEIERQDAPPVTPESPGDKPAQPIAVVGKKDNSEKDKSSDDKENE